jgi:phosphate transport system permease protein
MAAVTTVYAPGPAGPELRRRTGGARTTDVLAVVWAAAAATGLTGLVFTQIAPFSGLLGAVLLWYPLFIGGYALLVWLGEPGPAVRDRVAAATVHSLAALLLVALVFVVTYTLARGVPALRHLNFLVQDMTHAGPLDPVTVGGILHGIVGTLEQITIALLLTIPLGLLCAVYLTELPGPFARFTRTLVEAMTALPSIVAGLFIYATVILTLGLGKSGFAAALALSLMMLPIIIRAADVVLRLVPAGLKEASYALGAGQWRTVWHVVLPTARSGLVTAVILGTARGVGETSPVLLTAGFTATLNASPFHDAQVSLPLLAFNLVRSGQPAFVARGFGAAAVLMALVLLLFAIARILGGRGPGQLSDRQRRRLVAGSRRDARRFDTRLPQEGS